MANTMNDTNIPECLQNANITSKPSFANSTWVKPLELLTKEERSWMYRTNRSKACRHLLTVLARKGRTRAKEQRQLDKVGRTILVLPESAQGIDAINKQLLNAINEKYGEANILDIAKTMEILSNIKAKELKDCLELQARNYTPTVISQEKTEAPEQTEQLTTTDTIDKPQIDNDINTIDNTINTDTSKIAV